MLFSLTLALKIISVENRINPLELRFLMAAGTKTAVSHPNPIHKGDRVWLENKDWAAILEVSEFDSFANFHKNFTQYVNKWKEVWESRIRALAR